MCYFSDPDQQRSGKLRFNDEEVRRIANEFFPRAFQLYIGAAAEPTMYKNYPDIIRLAKEYKVPFVSLVSNGQLIQESHLEKFLKYGLDEITLSTHGVKRETYEHMMPGSSYDRFLQLLEAVDSIKTQRGSADPKIRINFTVNPDNLDELRDFFDVYGHVGVSTLQIRPIIDFGNVEYQKKDLTPYLRTYNSVLDDIEAECVARNVRLLCNRLDPTYSEPNVYAPVYAEGIIRVIEPGSVWNPDYDVMSESYRSYSQRSGFRKRMLDYATRRRPIPVKNTPLVSSEVV